MKSEGILGSSADSFTALWLPAGSCTALCLPIEPGSSEGINMEPVQQDPEHSQTVARKSVQVQHAAVAKTRRGYHGMQVAGERQAVGGSKHQGGKHAFIIVHV